MGTLDDIVRRALARPLPGIEAQLHMAPRLRTGPEPPVAPADLRPAAALLLIYPHAGAWHIPLTVRGSGLRHHTGQVSLPGGRLDAGESIEAAALREAHEEVALEPAVVDVLGRLTPLPIVVSGHLLHPVVGLASHRPDFRAAAGEVERVIEVPVARLRLPEVIRWQERPRALPPYAIMDVPYFDVEDECVWGATAMVLAEFLALVGEQDV